MKRLDTYRSLWIILCFAIVTLIVYRLLPYESLWVENWYSRGLFSIFRSIWDNTVGHLPFGFIYILVLGVIYYLCRPLIASYKGVESWRELMIRLIKVVGIALISFYWLWGFNYKRTSFQEVVDLSKDEPDEEFVYDEYCRITDSLVTLNSQLTDLYFDQEPVFSEGQLREDLETVFKKMQLPTAGKVRVRKLRPKGSLLHISTAGVYLPFTGEGHIDAGLHPITHPFTMMHEMSHGYGWTGEDVCNFLGLLGSINSKFIYTRYSGYFAYWRYLRSQIYQLDHERFAAFYQEIPEVILYDYKEIIAYSERYPDLLPQLRDIFYDNYLKSHGISSGLVNYSQMIVLSFQWQKKHGSLLFD